MLLAGALFAVAMVLGSSQAGALRRAPGSVESSGFSQRVFGAALMSACGRGLTTPAPAILAGTDTQPGTRAMRDFLLERRDRLACAEIPNDVPVEGLDGLQRASRYLLLLVAGSWRLAGPAWAGIDWLMGVMFAFTIAFAYVASRVAMGRLAAVAVAGLLMCSPLHLQQLADVRDYSKAPFFLFSLAAIGLLVTRPWPPLVTVIGSALTGAGLGIGFGMRTDVLVNLLLVIIAVPLGLPSRWRESWRARAAAAAACATAFALVATPLIGSFETRSSPWHVALLGYAHDWDRALEVRPAAYESGYFYSDSYVGTLVDAYWGRTTGAEARVAVGLPNYAEASRRYYFTMLTIFPADTVVRAWASVIKVLGLPFSGAAARDPGRAQRWPEQAITSLRRVQSRLEDFAVPVFVLLVLGVSARSIRLAVILLGLVVALGAYPSIQFQRRHIFHLEVISLWTFGVATSWLTGVVVEMARNRRPLRNARPKIARPLCFGLAVLGLVLLPLAAARAAQRKSVDALIAGYAAAPVAAIDVAAEPAGGGLVTIAGRQAIFARPDGARSMSSDMLVAEIGEACALSQATLTFRYGGTNPLLDFTRSYHVPRPQPGARARVYFPVYESGAATPSADRLVFSGIETTRAEAACVTRLGRFVTADMFPLLVPIVVTGTTAATTYYQQLQRWEAPPTVEAAPRQSYWSPPELRAAATTLVDQLVDAARFEGTVDYNNGMAHVGDDGRIRVDGWAESAGSYLVSWQPRAFGASSLLVVNGELERGGMTVGLADSSGWIASLDIDDPGAFRAALQVPAAGSYQVVVANHLRDGALRNRFTIARLAVIAGASSIETMK